MRCPLSCPLLHHISHLLYRSSVHLFYGHAGIKCAYCSPTLFFFLFFHLCFIFLKISIAQATDLNGFFPWLLIRYTFYYFNLTVHSYMQHHLLVFESVPFLAHSQDSSTLNDAFKLRWKTVLCPNSWFMRLLLSECQCRTKQCLWEIIVGKSR